MKTTKTNRRATLRAIRMVAEGTSRAGLDGCPVGGWPETQQAMLRLADELPDGADLHAVIDACYDVDAAGRYRWRAAGAAGGAS